MVWLVHTHVLHFMINTKHTHTHNHQFNQQEKMAGSKPPTNRRNVNNQENRKSNPLNKLILFSLLIVVVALLWYLATNDHRSVSTGRTSYSGTISNTDHNKSFKNETLESLFTMNENDSRYMKRGALETLAFVTPWNNKGYNIAKEYNNKFTYVSPVWFQIRPAKPEDALAQKYKYIVAGEHNIDVDWCGTIGSKKVFPRVAMDYTQFSKDHYTEIFNPTLGHIDELCEQIITLVERHKWGGIVLEYGFVPTHIILNTFLLPMLHKLWQKRITVILVIAPYRKPTEKQPEQLINQDHLIQLEPLVHRFMVMTYDYAIVQGIVGPNSPLDEMVIPTITHLLLGRKSTQGVPPVKGTEKKYDLLASKLLLGLNFYGYKFAQGSRNGEPILASQLQEMIKSTDRAKITFFYDSNAGEYWFKFPGYTVYYPTIRSISERLKVAHIWRLAGVGIWEIGQGFDEFYTLF
jgi:chitinase domain-containing protein 1